MGAIKGSTLKIVECSLCNDFVGKRLTSFEDHLKDSHGVEIQDHWNGINGGPVKCACGCGRETKWNGWWNGYSFVVTGHNGSIYSVCSPEEAAEITRKRSEALSGKPSWCAGLNKENDVRVARRGEATSRGRKQAFDEGRIVSWNKGKTAKDDERVAEAARNLQRMYAEGEAVPWAKGKTAEVDERIKRMGQNVSFAMRQENIRQRLDAIKRLSHDDIKNRVESSGNLRVVGCLDAYINDAHKIISVECKGCGENFTGSLRSLQYGKCFKCSPGGSKAQEDIAKWLVDLGVSIKRNDRKTLEGLEIDIFNPDVNVGVEYNGLYWHSHANKSSQYHSNKTKKSIEKGVKLIHVFEDEWRDKQEIIKSIILSKLSLSSHKIGARKCSIKELSLSERKSFFNENHIDGDTNVTVSWGLLDGESNIVSAISLRKPLHKKEGLIEVARCCTRIGFNVQGGIAKLVKVACGWARANGYCSMMTYVDTRLGGVGAGYEKAGFKKSGITPPRFWWTDFTHRFNRFKFKADPSTGRSEAEVAVDAKVVKIWGCENVVYSMIL